MEAKLQRRIQRYGWDKAAEYYEGFWRRALEPAQDRLLELAGLQPGERVLDVACGTGLVTFRAAEAVGASGSVVGTDISQRMVDVSTRTAAERGVTNLTFERMDAEDLRGLEDNDFDAALCALGLMFMPEPLAAVREMHRVLKPGGRAVCAVWGQRDRCGWAELFPIVDARVESEVCPMFFQMGTKDVLAMTFESAGFEDITLERLPAKLPFASAEEATGAALLGGAVALAYAKFDDPTKAAVEAEYLLSIDGYRNGAGYDVPAEFVMAMGRKK